jgi:hypothetical protein
LPAAAIPGGFFDQRRRLRMKYGYARVSTDDQNPALQLAAPKKSGMPNRFQG